MEKAKLTLMILVGWAIACAHNAVLLFDDITGNSAKYRTPEWDKLSNDDKAFWEDLVFQNSGSFFQTAPEDVHDNLILPALKERGWVFNTEYDFVTKKSPFIKPLKQFTEEEHRRYMVWHSNIVFILHADKIHPEKFHMPDPDTNQEIKDDNYQPNTEADVNAQLEQLQAKLDDIDLTDGEKLKGVVDTLKDIDRQIDEKQAEEDQDKQIVSDMEAMIPETEKVPETVSGEAMEGKVTESPNTQSEVTGPAPVKEATSKPMAKTAKAKKAK